MRFKLPKLHNQIIFALILGALFGSFFNVSRDSLVISHQTKEGIAQDVIENWNEFFLIIPTDKDTLKFGTDRQLDIIAETRVLRSEEKKFEVFVTDFEIDDQNIPSRRYTEVISASKERTVATGIKWIGDIFIRLLTMIAVPLVLASLTVGAASLGDIKKFARIGGKTIAFYLVTTGIAITIGLITANIIQPGKQMNAETKERLLSVYSEDVSAKLGSVVDYDITQEIVKMVPRNPIGAMADGEMLQIVFFALLLGLMLSLIKNTRAEPVIKFFDGLSDAMIKLVDVIMYMAPVGVFALIAATVSEFGFDILQTLVWYALAVVFGLFLHTFGTYSLFIKLFTKIKVLTFFKGIRQAQTIGFSTSSSAATLPVNMECCQQNLGVSKSITSFVLPLGATINMDGTALYQGVAAVFIAQVFGIELTLIQQLTIVFTATLASIGTAPVPGVGLIMLVIILKSVGIPEEGIALILGVDRILDMCRTITNITGDATATVVIATSEKEILTPNLKDA
jgi:proton glutamate symport protein